MFGWVKVIDEIFRLVGLVLQGQAKIREDLAKVLASVLAIQAGLESGTLPPVEPPPDEPPALPPLLWDERLTALKVTVERVAGARYPIIAAWLTESGNWDNVPAFAKVYQMDTLGGDHHCFGRCLDKAGNPLGKTFMLTWSTGQDGRIAGSDGWANMELAGQNWNPADGPGPYRWQALNSDVLVGVGMPLNRHVSFFIVCKEL